jgi:hypothetical protein
VVFTEDDHMIEKLAANAAHEAFGGSVLPGTSEGGSPGMDPKPPNRAGDLCREDRVVVEDQEPMGGFIGESLPKLLDHPTSRWIRGHVAVKDSSARVIDRKPDVEQVEADRWHDEEVHPRDHVPVIPQEGDPTLLGPARILLESPARREADSASGLPSEDERDRDGQKREQNQRGRLRRTHRENCRTIGAVDDRALYVNLETIRISEDTEHGGSGSVVVPPGERW